MTHRSRVAHANRASLAASASKGETRWSTHVGGPRAYELAGPRWGCMSFGDGSREKWALDLVLAKKPY